MQAARLQPEGGFWTGASGESGKSEIRMPFRYRFDLKIVANAPDKEGERKSGLFFFLKKGKKERGNFNFYLPKSR